MKSGFYVLILAVLVLMSPSVHAEQTITSKGDAIQDQVKRSKDIQFDDSVVEGMNKRSKDSLEVVSHDEDPNRMHLFHKRTEFKSELKQLSIEVESQ
jgi:hypothetical protein